MSTDIKNCDGTESDIAQTKDFVLEKIAGLIQLDHSRDGAKDKVMEILRNQNEARNQPGLHSSSDDGTEKFYEASCIFPEFPQTPEAIAQRRAIATSLAHVWDDEELLEGV